ncbi:hypothetical protein [Pedobacter sp. JY14-1]|uniref:hypothetical protein n=1 Tax=Pedobacter sp. JY14-1 TaxID=3034151 RepID=UPI0023E23672|nr:hypothetical protein [Pedobacter sp. JY14-1]
MRKRKMNGRDGLSVRIYRKNSGQINSNDKAGSVRKMVSAGVAYRNEGSGNRNGSSIQRSICSGSIIFCFGNRRLRIHVLDVKALQRNIRSVSMALRQGVLQVQGPRRRNWIIDIGLRSSGDSLLSVW